MKYDPWVMFKKLHYEEMKNPLRASKTSAGDSNAKKSVANFSFEFHFLMHNVSFL